MNVTDYRRLESKLVEAEELLLQNDTFGAKALEIRDQLRDLLAKVVTERIRAETAERKTGRSNR